MRGKFLAELARLGRFRRSPRGRWMRCEAWQYNSRLEIARIFHMNLWMGGVLPVIGRDIYRDGKGRMLIRPLDLFTVQDARGPEFDIGELVTWVNDAVLMAPSMLLGPEIAWAGVDEASFDVSVTHGGNTVTGRVFVDGRGAPVDFSTRDRFMEDLAHPGHALVRARWNTPEGPFHYAEFRPVPGAFAANVRPGD